MEEIFKEKDRDFDGTMSYEEFTGHDTKTELAFRAIDKNGDGYVSKVKTLNQEGLVQRVFAQKDICSKFRCIANDIFHGLRSSVSEC